MDANTYFRLKLRRVNTLLADIERAYASFDELQKLESELHANEDDRCPDVRAVGQDMLDLLGNLEAFRDATSFLVESSRPR